MNSSAKLETTKEADRMSAGAASFPPARILGIESSCDETAAAVVENGRSLLSNVVASQIDIHAKYGGVFPEVASRQHIRTIYAVVEEALQQAHLTLANLDAIAVTRGPGLAGSLVVGMNTAKGLALASGLPLIGVNHLEGHIYSRIRPTRPPRRSFRCWRCWFPVVTPN
jgi:N6-L-threonylcarbamoyladenine synthase